ncbi:MAG: hypothetical protein K9J30_00180 [Bacteroidales bacterium]|nr:hypothetical protein [Bacteroidales bacterium]
MNTPIKHLIIYTAIAFLLPAMSLFAQEAEYYYSSDLGITENGKNAVYKREVFHRCSNVRKVFTYKMTDKGWIQEKKEKVRLVNDTLMIIKRPGEKLFREKVTRTFYETEYNRYLFTDHLKGKVILEGTATNLVPLHLQDTVVSYYKTGTLKSIAVYDGNSLVTNQNWLRNGSRYYDDLHYFVDKIPEYSYGQANFRAYILKGIRDSGIDLNQIRDKVVIGWVVMENGELEGFHTIRGVYKPLNNTLIKLIREMPGDWVAASLNGKKVRYYMTLPFNFIDRTENFESLELSTGWVVWD